MRFLVDNSALPRLALELRARGHDALHIRDLASSSAADEVVFELAASEHRVLIALDTDFATILANRSASAPSLMLFRRRERSTQSIIAAIDANLAAIEGDLKSGSVVVFDDARIRVRPLPIQMDRDDG